MRVAAVTSRRSSSRSRRHEKAMIRARTIRADRIEDAQGPQRPGAGLAGAPSSSVQNEVLKSVSVSRATGVVGTTNDTGNPRRTASKEADRDWTGRVERIIEVRERPRQARHHAGRRHPARHRAVARHGDEECEARPVRELSGRELVIRAPAHEGARPGARRARPPVQGQQPRLRPHAGARQPDRPCRAVRPIGAYSKFPSSWPRTAAPPSSCSASIRSTAGLWTSTCVKPRTA